MRPLRTLVFAVLAVLSATPAAAQSLFATRGLGMPVAPLDARARALGGIGVGLIGFDMSFANPAEVAGLGRRGVVASLQPGSASPTIDGATGDISASRFPLIRLAYPLGQSFVASLGYASALEQSWSISESGTEIIGRDTVDTRDVISATGGVARVGLGLAWRITETVSVGLAGGLYTGNLDRRVTRTFSDSTIGLQPFDTRLQWDYSGTWATAGARFDLPGVARFGASLSISGDLDVNGLDEGARDDRADMPMIFTAGASGVLSSTLTAAAGTEWTGGAAGRVLQAEDAVSFRRDTWRAGGGLEYTGWRGAARTWPIRLGVNWAQLPFHDEGETPASEWAAGFGFGLNVTGDAASPLAILDMSVERGSRSGLESTALPGGLSESFWRWTFSLSLFGL
jgi:hypothetical protein